MVEVMLLSVWLVLVRSVQGMTAYVCLSMGIQYNNSPIGFGFRLLDSNDHAIALAAQNIANKATGDAIDTDHSRSKCIELIFSTGPIQKSISPTSLFREPKILYKLYANISINGILEYQYTILGAGLAYSDMAMRCSAGLSTKETTLYKERISSTVCPKGKPYRLIALDCRATILQGESEDPILRARKGKFEGHPQTAAAFRAG